MRVLLAWELGGNYGHISILVCLARQLRQRGHQIIFAIKESDLAEQLLGGEKFNHVQAPRPEIGQNHVNRPVSFADILAGAGFNSYECLAGLVGAWQAIFNEQQVQIIVAQYAPVAQFSARLSGLPCLSLNTGFECPPDVIPFPCFRANMKVAREQLVAREEQLLGEIKQISRGRASFKSLHDILKCDVSLLATFPELDHYWRRPKGRYIGPISSIEHGVALSWRKKKGVRIFLYLRTFHGIEHILNDLSVREADIIAHIPGLDPKLSAVYDNTSIRLVDSAVRLSGLMPDMDVAILHGGHGTVAAAFLAGVPVVLIPTTIEQWLMSRNVTALGIGIALRRERIDKTFATALDQLLTDSTFSVNAKKLAARYTGYDQQQVIVKIVNTIERLPAACGRQCLVAGQESTG